MTKVWWKVANVYNFFLHCKNRHYWCFKKNLSDRRKSKKYLYEKYITLSNKRKYNVITEKF